MRFKNYLTILLILFTFTAYSHEVSIKDKNVEEIVKLRMKAMSQINSLSKKIYKNLESADFKKLNEYALELKHNTNEFKLWFPENSIGGKAKELIWKDKKLFDEYIETFLKDINLIIKNIENKDIALLNENFNKMTSNCGTCHKKFKSR